MEKYLLALTLTFLLLNCSTSHTAYDAREDARFNKWLHHSKAELIQKWGEPDSTKPNGSRGEILIYKEGVDYKSVMNGKYTGPQYSFRKEMYVNTNGLIYYWKAWRRN